MLAEVLLVLSGHPSAFFVAPAGPSGTGNESTLKVSPSLAEHLHPGEVASLNTLGQLAFRYRRIRSWSQAVQTRVRESILAESSRTGRDKGKGKERERGNPVHVDNSGDIQPGVYMATLAAGVLGVLREYEMLIVDMEARILAVDPELVQDGRSYVPLSTIVATFDSWQQVLASLHHLVETLSSAPTNVGDNGSWTPGWILHYLAQQCQTGNSRLAEIYTTLFQGIQNLFLGHLIAFLLFGLTASESTPTAPTLGLDMGSDPLSPLHRIYKLDDELLPPSIGARTRESMLYIGRVAATLKREGKSLPGGLMKEVREEIMAAKSLEDGDGLDQAISRARAEVGEWLWKNILTGPQVIRAIESFGDYYLLRKADFALSVTREFHRLQQTKLLSTNPRSSTAVIREADLNNAMLRASLGTSAESDSALDQLSWKLPDGPIRPIMPSLQGRKRTTGTSTENAIAGGTRDLFAAAVLGAPLELKMRIGWPLDLFITPSAVSAYSEIHAYLFALQDTHARLLQSWGRLAARHRRGLRLKNTQREGADAMLTKSMWSTIQAMLFFVDQLVGHFMTDIIDVQHRRLLEELEAVGLNERERRLQRSESGISPAASLRGSIRHKTSISRLDSVSRFSERADSPNSDDAAGLTGSVRSRAPPTPRRTQATFLDFLTLRQMHTRHLAFLREGLLLADRSVAALIRDITDTCKRFTGIAERWSREGAVDPLGGEYADSRVAERVQQVREVGRTFNEQITDFFRILLESQNPIQAKDDASSTGTGGTSFSKTARTIQMSRLMSRHTTFSMTSKAHGRDGVVKSKADVERDSKVLEAEAAMGRHIEQLLLRLDFNGVLTNWIASEEEGQQSRHVLAEGGL